MKSELRFSWEDNEHAGLRHFKCGGCGYVEDHGLWGDGNEPVVSCWDDYECPECGKKFELIWCGMKWVEVKNE